MIVVAAVAVGAAVAAAGSVKPAKPAQLTVSVAAPNAPARGIVKLQATAIAATNGARLGWVDFTIDGSVVGSAVTAPYFLPWNTAAVPAGRHTLVAIAHATDGTTAASPAATVETDGTAAYTVDAGAYPSLAAAVAALPASGGSVHVPAGTYAVNDLTLGSHVHLVGDGAGSTILRAPTGSNYGSVLRIAGTDVSVSDLAIDGNGAAQTGGAGWVVQVRGVSDHVLLQRLSIRAPRTVGVYAWGTYRDVSVQDSVIDGAGTADTGVEYAQGAADAVNSDASVLRTTITRFKGYGINFFPWLGGKAYPGPRALAAGNTITDISDPAVADGTSEGGIWAGGQDAVIRDNTIARTGWDGIETFGNALRARIEGNRISDTQFGVYLEHGTYDGLIQGNTISRVHLGIDIEWWYGGQGSQRQTIRRNVITGAEAGINVDVGADGNTIEGNAITDTATYGIRLQGTSHNAVRGNDLRRSGRQGAMVETVGQTDTGAAARPGANAVTGNDCRGGGGVRLIGASSVASGNLT